MFTATFSNSTSLSEEASGSTCTTKVQDFSSFNHLLSDISPHQPQPLEIGKIKKKRNLPGNPDPDAEVIALSPRTLLATNRFVCEICNKGFQRDQNLQLHRRGHNLPWKLRQRNSKEIKKKVYICPEVSCVHHNPSRALGDLTGIKKHFCRKHGEKKWKCEKCSKKYAVQSDWKAHSKTCGTKEYRCDCGTLFSRKDSFITHRAFCDALAEESARLSSANPAEPVSTTTITNPTPLIPNHPSDHNLLPLHLHPAQNHPAPSSIFSMFTSQHQNYSNPQTLWNPLQNPNSTQNPLHEIKTEATHTQQHQNELIPNNKGSNSNNSTSIISSFFQEPPHKPLTTPGSSFLDQQPMNLISNTNTPHLSATALLQKAANVGAAALTSTGSGPSGGSGGNSSSSATQTQSVGYHMGSSMTRLQMNEFGSVSQMGSNGYLHGFAQSNLAAWQKNDYLTKDFLSLAAGDSVSNGAGVGGGGSNTTCGGASNNHHHGQGGGNSLNSTDNGNVNVSVSVKDLLSFTGGVDFPAYDRDHSLLKASGYGYAGTWRDC